MPRVSVIIAAYNSSQTLACALRSLRLQTFEDFEAWVVGDACTDESEQVVAFFSDPRLHWLNLPQHRGCQTWPNNEGLERASGQYIAYLGHDDLWFPWHLAALVATLEQTGADFVYSATARVGPAGPVELAGPPKVRRSYAYRFIPPSSWLHRREMVDTCGDWPNPQGQTSTVDAVFMRRAFVAGQRFASCGQISVVKFPSTWWRPYGRKIGHPQTDYVRNMERNATQVHQQLLTELLFATVRDRENRTVSESLSTAKAALRSQIADWYGWDRWPLSQYLKWNAKRWRENAFLLRGLTVDDRPVDDPAAQNYIGDVSLRTSRTAHPSHQRTSP